MKVLLDTAKGSIVIIAETRAHGMFGVDHVSTMTELLTLEEAHDFQAKLGKLIKQAERAF